LKPLNNNNNNKQKSIKLYSFIRKAKGFSNIQFTKITLLPTGLFFAPIWEVPGEDFPCEFEGPDFCVLLRGLLLGDFDGDTPSEDPDPEQSALQPLFRGLKFTSARTCNIKSHHCQLDTIINY